MKVNEMMHKMRTPGMRFQCQNFWEKAMYFGDLIDYSLKQYRDVKHVFNHHEHYIFLMCHNIVRFKSLFNAGPSHFNLNSEVIDFANFLSEAYVIFSPTIQKYPNWVIRRINPDSLFYHRKTSYPPKKIKTKPEIEKYFTSTSVPGKKKLSSKT